jgi:O-methyltransferase involved in polyketide biosynthesis
MYRPVLVLGLGFDPKPEQFAHGSQVWFGLDLRDTLKERERRFQPLRGKSERMVTVAADLRNGEWTEALLRSGFQDEAPTLVVFEGLSMYLNREEVASLMAQLRRLLKSPHSRLWLDHVTPDLFDLDLPEVRAFLSSMNRLGEPFITGFDNAAGLAGDLWQIAETTTAAAVVGLVEPVHQEYRFSILRPAMI